MTHRSESKEEQTPAIPVGSFHVRGTMEFMKPIEVVDWVEAVLGKRAMFLTTEEFAQITRSHPATVRQQCRRGELKATHTGSGRGRWKIPVSEMEQYLTRS